MFAEIKPPSEPRVALVGCSALKQKRPAPARELYTSGLFRASLAFAEATCAEVFVVSAMYGLLSLEQVVEPYDRTLADLGGKNAREDWGARTLASFVQREIAPQLVVLAGELYAEALMAGAHWHNLPRPEAPLRGLRGCGNRIAWLKARTSKPEDRGAA